MKKKSNYHKSLIKILRLSFMQLALIMVFTSINAATPAIGQESLDKRISISLKNVTLESALIDLQAVSKVKFSYNSRSQKLNNRVSLIADNEPLSDVLSHILKPLNVDFVQISNRIVLKFNEADGSRSISEIEKLSSNTKILDSENTVTGTVFDENGDLLPGVSVFVKSTTIGTITDQDGKFSLSIPDENSILVFSFVGYNTQEVIIGGKTNLSVTLKVDNKLLDEVIVVGYGIQKKKDLTGAISSISGEMFKERKETQVSQALQGAMSGVLVTRNGANGAMGGASIRIRGITTIGDSNPLVIVDGVPVSDVNQVNPNDIESLTVLKDAASASIYGSRAAAGVILITTKRAASGQSSLQYSFERGFDTPTQLPDYMRSSRYMQLVNELRWNDAGNGANKFPTFSEDLLKDYDAKHIANPDQFPDTDWMALTLNKMAPREAHSISVIGGSNFVKSNASIRYEKVGGFYENKDYGRIFVRSNNDFTVNKLIGGTLDFNFKRTNSVDPTANDPLGRIRISSPIYPALWADGRLADGKAGENVYGKIKYGGTNTNNFNQIGGRMALNLTPIKDLRLSAILSPIFDFNNQKRFNKKVDVFAPDNPNQFIGTLISGGLTTRLDENRTTNYSLTTQLLANYLKTVGDHDFTGLLGYENYYFKNESIGASRDQFLFDTYPYLNQGPPTLRDNFGSAFETAYRSYFGRITYSFKEKYLLQANFRRDGSSRFNTNYRWGNFPSISAGWVVSQEDFLQKAPLISFLKLRASWGTLGNERIGNYPSVGIMSFGNALFYQNNVPVPQQTAAQIQYAIQDISWEKTSSIDIGFDAYFLKNKLRLIVDAYQKETSDMLLALQIPIFVGFENPNQNTGTMTTKGIDIDLGWTDNVGKLKYSISGNLSQFQSIMGNLGGTEFIGDRIKREGSQFDEWFGYVSAGIYQNQEDVNTSPKLNNNVKVGDLKYVDISGPNGEPDGRISPEYDRVLMGSSQPQWMYGASLRLDYNSFDLSVTAQGIGYQNTSMLQYTDYNAENWGVFPVFMDGTSYSVNKSPEQNLNAKYPRFTETNKNLNRAMSDFWLFNGGYFRLKNVTLGYNLPSSYTSKFLVNTMRVYLNASDIFTINKYPKGWDPEGLGIVSTFIGGVNIGF